MRFAVKVLKMNDIHVRFEILADDDICGNLVMTAEQWVQFTALMLVGAIHIEGIDVSTIHYRE